MFEVIVEKWQLLSKWWYNIAV